MFAGRAVPYPADARWQEVSVAGGDLFLRTAGLTVFVRR